MPITYSTVAAASSVRIRTGRVTTKPAPLSAEQLKEKRAATAKKQEAIDDVVNEWRDYTNEKASELAIKFDMKARYFLELFFQGGAHMINHQEKINPYNAFKSEKAAEARERKLLTLLLIFA